MHVQRNLLPRQGGNGGGSPSLLQTTSSLMDTTTPATLSATSSTSPTAAASIIPTTITDPSSNSGSSSKVNIIIPVIVIFIVFLLTVFCVILCRSCRRNHKTPKYIPTQFLKKRWEGWQIRPHGQRLQQQTNEHLERSRNGQPPARFDMTAGQTTTVGVDRNTSVRSVMTLPAYAISARENEQVLGREGERGGIDTVVEFPEGADEEESRREEEMEALYQVRLARRRENEEREERRRLRREARERGDTVALREIQARARTEAAANAGRTVAELRAEHDRLKAERQRAVSSVAYGDLGVARHDGTRLRANSEESERQGLLGDAASIAASSRYHRRDRSASSIISIDTVNSDLPSPGLTRSRANSRAESPLRRVSTGNTTSHDGRAGSSPELIDHEHEHDLEDLPLNSPPGYENIPLDTPHTNTPPPVEPPPDYTSPVLGRGEGPTIDSMSAATPAVGLGLQDTRPRSERTTSSGSVVTGGSAERSASSSSAHSSRGVGGVPQLPSLRLSSLPSIIVDAGSPVTRQSRIDEEETHP
ncbi:hypothetical protein BP6252_07261 [Coleophoma cylindrospora]|uniref:Uncharacterized protein n=1 Tax=Coleophoma cylindrospora TaxID=1849047 RepID=A0A3D8RHI3_9HELO|nr:hypothetical protein BP6252_07261 [Coleophoma cylindrospora]